ncbi:MAG: hypothetical protein VST68_06940 [Nitrospirota bacterium]|nr:hypothetical protein [Nitrospirota bacterium]
MAGHQSQAIPSYLFLLEWCWWEWAKKSVQQDRSIACCVPEGATVVDARSVLPVREHDKMARTLLAAFFNIPFVKPHPFDTNS